MDLSLNNQHSTHEDLAVHEWLAIITILGFLAMLTMISISVRYAEMESETFTSTPHYLKPQEYEILIQGAVENEGSYQVKVGTRVLDAIEIAKPLPDADLRRIGPKSKIRNGQIITILKKKIIEIELTGAVKKEGVFKVPHGTRLQELVNFVELAPDADIEKLQKKRFLKSGEKLKIQPKTEKIKKN